jgi:hypothetical protein
MEVIGGLLKKLGCPTNKYYNKNWLGLPTQLVRKMLSESGGALTSTLERMLSYKKVAFWLPFGSQKICNSYGPIVYRRDFVLALIKRLERNFIDLL